MFRDDGPARHGAGPSLRRLSVFSQLESRLPTLDFPCCKAHIAVKELPANDQLSSPV